MRPITKGGHIGELGARAIVIAGSRGRGGLGGGLGLKGLDRSFERGLGSVKISLGLGFLKGLLGGGDGLGQSLGGLVGVGGGIELLGLFDGLLKLGLVHGVLLERVDGGLEIGNGLLHGLNALGGVDAHVLQLFGGLLGLGVSLPALGGVLGLFAVGGGGGNEVCHGVAVGRTDQGEERRLFVAAAVPDLAAGAAVEGVAVAGAVDGDGANLAFVGLFEHDVNQVCPVVGLQALGFGIAGAEVVLAAHRTVGNVVGVAVLLAAAAVGAGAALVPFFHTLGDTDGGLAGIELRVDLKVGTHVGLGEADLVGDLQAFFDLIAEQINGGIGIGQTGLHAVAVDVAGLIDGLEDVEGVGHLGLIEHAGVHVVVVVQLPVDAQLLLPLSGGGEGHADPLGFGLQTLLRLVVELLVTVDGAPGAGLVGGVVQVGLAPARAVPAVADHAVVVVERFVDDIPGQDDVVPLLIALEHGLNVAVDTKVHNLGGDQRLAGVEALVVEGGVLLGAVPEQHVLTVVLLGAFGMLLVPLLDAVEVACQRVVGTQQDDAVGFLDLLRLLFCRQRVVGVDGGNSLVVGVSGLVGAEVVGHLAGVAGEGVVLAGDLVAVGALRAEVAEGEVVTVFLGQGVHLVPVLAPTALQGDVGGDGRGEVVAADRGAAPPAAGAGLNAPVVEAVAHAGGGLDGLDGHALFDLDHFGLWRAGVVIVEGDLVLGQVGGALQTGNGVIQGLGGGVQLSLGGGGVQSELGSGQSLVEHSQGFLGVVSAGHVVGLTDRGAQGLLVQLHLGAAHQRIQPDGAAVGLAVPVGLGHAGGVEAGLAATEGEVVVGALIGVGVDSVAAVGTLIEGDHGVLLVVRVHGTNAQGRGAGVARAAQKLAAGLIKEEEAIGAVTGVGCALGGFDVPLDAVGNLAGDLVALDGDLGGTQGLALVSVVAADVAGDVVHGVLAVGHDDVGLAGLDLGGEGPGGLVLFDAFKFQTLQGELVVGGLAGVGVDDDLVGVDPAVCIGEHLGEVLAVVAAVAGVGGAFLLNAQEIGFVVGVKAGGAGLGFLGDGAILADKVLHGAVAAADADQVLVVAALRGEEAEELVVAVGSGVLVELNLEGRGPVAGDGDLDGVNVRLGNVPLGGLGTALGAEQGKADALFHFTSVLADNLILVGVVLCGEVDALHAGFGCCGGSENGRGKQAQHQQQDQQDADCALHACHENFLLLS